MREIQVRKWKAKYPAFKDGKPTGKIHKTNEDTVKLFRVLMNKGSGKSIMMFGFESYNLINEAMKVLHESEQTGIMRMSEPVYDFFIELLKSQVPSFWAMNPDISKTIEEFLNSPMITKGNITVAEQMEVEQYV